MSSGAIQLLLKEMAVLGMFLILGMFLRAKVPFFRNMLLPASVIGGFILLAIGPQVWGWEKSLIPITEDYMTTWSNLSGVLIVPIFAGVPLGDGLDPRVPKKSIKDNLPAALGAIGLFSGVSAVQGVLGWGTHIVLDKMNYDMYPCFGFELGQGYAGGHGTAAGLGGILQGYGFDYWQLSQAVATTFATVGLMGGMIMGIAFINRAARRGETKVLEKPSDMPFDTARGYIKDLDKQKMMGRETTHSSSIETITIHLSIILIVSALAYWGLAFSKAHKLTGLDSIPVWFYALLIMYAVNFLLKKLNLGWMVDSKIRARITGCMSDFAIISAIASMPIKAVAAYVVPIVVLCILGFVITYIWCFVLHKKVFGKNGYFFERSIICWGTGTGVMINGMMLLKIADPDYETPALTDFSLGWALMSLTSIFTSPVTYSLLRAQNFVGSFLWSLTMLVGWSIVAVVGMTMMKKQHPENYA